MQEESTNHQAEEPTNHQPEEATKKPVKRRKKAVAASTAVPSNALTKQQVVEAVLHNFNFETTYDVMKTIGWQWATAVNEDGVPSTGQLVLLAKELLDIVYNTAKKTGASYVISSGGLEARADVFKEQEIVLELRFVVTYCNYSTKNKVY